MLGERIVPRSEVIGTILLGHSPCCVWGGGGAAHRPVACILRGMRTGRVSKACIPTEHSPFDSLRDETTRRSPTNRNTVTSNQKSRADTWVGSRICRRAKTLRSPAAVAETVIVLTLSLCRY